jgi:hypothetical protein
MSMNSATPTHLDSTETARPVDALSAEPARRSVELAFLRRFTDAAKTASAAILQRAQNDDSVSAGLARMQSPAFKRAARALEQAVPTDAGFGRFRDQP